MDFFPGFPFFEECQVQRWIVALWIYFLFLPFFCFLIPSTAILPNIAHPSETTDLVPTIPAMAPSIRSRMAQPHSTFRLTLDLSFTPRLFATPG